MRVLRVVDELEAAREVRSVRRLGTLSARLAKSEHLEGQQAVAALLARDRDAGVVPEVAARPCL